MPSTTLATSEIFSTVQGEGPSLGKRATFLRLALCNLRCAWCDTPYTWDWDSYNKEEQVHVKPVEVVANELSELPLTPLLVITGGEPLLQAPGLKTLLMDHAIAQYYDEIEVETNGTIIPPTWMYDAEVRFNVSPKLLNSGTHHLMDPIDYEVLSSIASGFDSRFKFVCKNNRDFSEVETIQRAIGIPDDRIWIMPEGRDAVGINARLSYMAEEVIERGWNITTRLHVQLWGNIRAK